MELTAVSTSKPRPASVAAPKRVLLVNPWSTCHGGTSIVLLEFVKHLDRSRFEPIVLCPAEGELPERLRELQVDCLIHSISGWTKQSWFRFLRDAYWCVRLLRHERIDLVHLNGPKWRSSIAWAAHYCEVPLVVHVHNPVRHAEKNFSFGWAQRILPVSNAVGEMLWKNESLAKKTETIHNGVELDLFLSKGENNRSEIVRSDDSLVIGFVGQIVPRKGLLCLIEALGRVVQQQPNAKLVVVGCAPHDQQEYEQKCRQLVNDLGIANYVEFVGFRRDVDRWMRTFDLFVLPTRSEPFGKVIIEAMSACCAVVATRVGGIPEIIQTPEHGRLVPPDDPAALTNVILDLLKNSEQRRKIAEAGCRHARENFSMKAMIDRLQNVYSEAIRSCR